MEAHTAARLSSDDLLRIAAAAEGSTRHPLAEAMAVAAGERGLVVPGCSDAVTEPGEGVTALVEGRQVRSPLEFIRQGWSTNVPRGHCSKERRYPSVQINNSGCNTQTSLKIACRGYFAEACTCVLGKITLLQ